MGAYPLQDGEQVMWSGRPQRPQRWFYEHTVLLVITVLVVTSVVVTTALSGPPTLVTTWYLAVIVAAGLFTERLKTRRGWAHAVIYQVTSHRIIFIAQWPAGAEFRWVWLGPLSEPRVSAGADGVGTVTFRINPLTRWQLRNNELQGAWAPFVAELRNIPDAQQVADLITWLQGRSLPSCPEGRLQSAQWSEGRLQSTGWTEGVLQVVAQQAVRWSEGEQGLVSGVAG